MAPAYGSNSTARDARSNEHGAKNPAKPRCNNNNKLLTPFSLSVGEIAELADTVPGIRAVRHNLPLPRGRGPVFDLLVWRTQRQAGAPPGSSAGRNQRPMIATLTLLEFGSYWPVQLLASGPCLDAAPRYGSAFWGQRVSRLSALIKPAEGNGEVVVAAVASRDVSRAQAFAAEHGIAGVYGSYEALIADPDLDAVYNPLPTALHGRWTRAALAAGKHVLCEKPFTANAAEACEIAELAAKSDRVVMEALHYRYHPFALRVEQIIASGELGTLQRVEAEWCFWVRKSADIRYNYSLGGGALMDSGCYAVDMVRRFGGSTPEVVSAQAKLRGPQVDRVMTAELRFAGGHTGRIHCSMWSTDLPRLTVKVVGDRGELRLHPLILFQRFSVRTNHRKEC